MEKYFNDAIIGNQKMTVSYTKKGELLRLLYPTTDYRQFIDYFHVGIKINDSGIIYLHDDINNVYNQYYEKDTNILNTEIVNTYFKLKIIQTDFVCIKENVLVKKYKFINENNIDLDLNFLVHSKLISSDNNQVSGYCKNDYLLQYMHDYTLCTFSKNKISSSQINNTSAKICEGNIWDKDYVGMSSDSSVQYDLETLKPNEEKEIEVFIYIDENKTGLDGIDKEIERIKKIDFRDEIENTRKYWKKYLKSHQTLELKIPESPSKNKIMEIYERTILLYPLLINEKTGGISAGVETDEFKVMCGKYSFCWPRDAVFITKAYDIIGMEEESKKFYEIFCKKTQSRDGKWEQRFYTDGRLASCWGFQIDETASVIIGVYDHYEYCKDKKFLKETLKMCENAIKFLEKYIEKVLAGEELKYGYDLWEEFEGLSFYSISAIFCAYEKMIKIYEEVKELFENNRLKLESINKQLKILNEQIVFIKDFALRKFYDEEKKCYVRNTFDRKMDISILGAVTPFNMLKPKEKNVLNTIDRIDMTLRTYTGGYVRYENDSYLGGYNPWPIATLWMALYCLEKGENKNALEKFEFVVNSCSEYGLLGEQVDNKTMSPAWIIGLAWSHAMFIIVLERLKKLKLI